MLSAADLPVSEEAAALGLEIEADDQQAEDQADGRQTADDESGAAATVARPAGGSFSEAWVFYTVAVLVAGSAMGCVLSVNGLNWPRSARVGSFSFLNPCTISGCRCCASHCCGYHGRLGQGYDRTYCRRVHHRSDTGQLAKERW
jgi:hypothetical protein